MFVDPEQADEVLAAFPEAVVATAEKRLELAGIGQVRLWWDTTPIDVFLDTTPFHRAVASRIRWEPFAGIDTPFLGCRDIAVFKTFFDRTRDWADLEEMAAAGSLDVEAVIGVLANHLDGDDHRIERLRRLAV